MLCLFLVVPLPAQNAISFTIEPEATTVVGPEDELLLIWQVDQTVNFTATFTGVDTNLKVNYEEKNTNLFTLDIQQVAIGDYYISVKAETSEVVTWSNVSLTVLGSQIESTYDAGDLFEALIGVVIWLIVFVIVIAWILEILLYR